MEYITRGVCGQEGCRERRYYLDNGIWWCRRGHQQEGRQIEEDPDDFGTQGKRNRVKKAAIETGQKTYHGRQAITLFLQTYQLILWKQCHALIQDRGFPDYFEDVIRDLWALRLQKYESRIGDPADSEDEPQFFSSQSGAEQSDEPGSIKVGNKLVKFPRLIETVALCYIGALVMRMPLGVADFHRMVMLGQIPYLRVIKTIPSEMRDKLPPQYIALIESSQVLGAEDLHTAVFDVLSLYQKKFDMQFPPLNYPDLLYNYLRRLALPVEIYPCVKRLRELLGFSFEFQTKIVGKRRPLQFAEVQLVTLIVIAAKLLFPFDDLERYPVSAEEPATQVLDWRLWAAAQKYFADRDTNAGRIGRGKEILVKEEDVFTLTPAQLDEYLEWYEKSWLDTSKEPPNPLAKMFPSGLNSTEDEQTATTAAEEDEESALNDLVQSVTGDISSRKVIRKSTNEDLPRPGAMYARYRMEADLPETAKAFYETVAKVAGISLKTLVRSVSQAESKIIRWLEDRRRLKYHGQLDESSEEYSNDSDGMA